MPNLQDLPNKALKALYALTAFAPKPEQFNRKAARAVARCSNATLFVDCQEAD